MDIGGVFLQEEEEMENPITFEELVLAMLFVTIPYFILLGLYEWGKRVVKDAKKLNRRRKG
jgi:hypothetical protein